jgi:hypothetical protein
MANGRKFPDYQAVFKRIRQIWSLAHSGPRVTALICTIFKESTHDQITQSRYDARGCGRPHHGSCTNSRISHVRTYFTQQLQRVFGQAKEGQKS